MGEKSFVLIVLLLLFSVHVMCEIRSVVGWTGPTVKILADGSIEPADAPIQRNGNVYTLTDDIVNNDFRDGVVISRPDTVFDGAQHFVEGTQNYAYYGVRVGASNVTVKSLNIIKWFGGIYVGGMMDTVSGNNVTQITRYGIGCAGYASLICDNRVEGVSDAYYGILLVSALNVTISGNKLRGYWYAIYVTEGSAHNNIKNNKIESYNVVGVGLMHGSSNNSVTGNEITGCGSSGIDTYVSANYNIIADNSLTRNWAGISCRSSGNNVITGNDIRENVDRGIYLQVSENNTICQNLVENHTYGIYLEGSQNNHIYHNAWLNNSIQVYISSLSTNTWDDGYPSGGNYWSDYTGTDFYNGPNQDVLGSDGIGDTPYVVDLNNADHYPLMTQWKPPTDWWPMFQHDPQHTGKSMGDGPDTNKTLWIFQTRDDVVSSPAVVDGRVFVGSWDWNVYCLDYVTGMELWRKNVGGWPYSSSPAVADGVVYVGSTTEYAGKVFALNTTTGSVIWQRNFDSSQRSNLNIHEGILYVGYRGGLYALNASTGSSIWIAPTPIHLWGSPAISEGILYVAGGLNLTALNATTGAFLWTKKIDVWPMDEQAPTVAYGMVFIGTSHNTLALNATNGEIIWTSLSSSGECAPAVSEGKLVVVRRGSPGAFALNATTGTSIWTCTFCSNVASSPAVAGGMVFLGSLDSKIYALNETNGEVCWVYQTSDQIWGSSPAIADGKLYIGSLDGKVYAIGSAHDVSLKNATTSKTGCLPAATAGKGCNVSINVTLENQGDFPETSLVIARGNSSEVARQQVTLDPKESVVLSFAWETASFSMGNYSIEVVTNSVLGEGDISDNTLACGWVLVTLAGDVDGDREVDIFDVVRMAGVYGISKPDPRYNPNCDIDGDGDIDIFDLVMAAGNYGKSW